VLVFAGIDFSKTHNIGMLLYLLPATIPHDPILDEAISLTDYAVSSRYPGEAEDVTEEELSAAVALADQVVAWASRVTTA
jgi:HEPN domain-containing protein